MPNYQAKTELVLAKQLKVQTLSFPFSILGNATPASVVVSQDDPALLFIQTEGTDRITVAAGALDSGEAVPTYTAPNDANGQFAILVKVSEAIKKVHSAKIVRRNGQEVISCSMANTTGLSANGDKIALNADSAVALNAANTLDACLEVSYEVVE